MQTIESLERDVRALRELRDSYGWHLVKKIIEDDVVAACFSMADSVLMTEKEIDFRRGAISAARNLLNIDTALLSRLEADLLLASNGLDATTHNATA